MSNQRYSPEFRHEAVRQIIRDSRNVILAKFEKGTGRIEIQKAGRLLTLGRL